MHAARRSMRTASSSPSTTARRSRRSSPHSAFTSRVCPWTSTSGSSSYSVRSSTGRATCSQSQRRSRHARPSSRLSRVERIHKTLASISPAWTWLWTWLWWWLLATPCAPSCRKNLGQGHAGLNWPEARRCMISDLRGRYRPARRERPGNREGVKPRLPLRLISLSDIKVERSLDMF